MLLITFLSEMRSPQALQIEEVKGTTREKLPDTTNLSYRFGFLAYKGTCINLPSATHNWRHQRFAEFQIFTHPEASILRIDTPLGQALVIGDIYVAHGNIALKHVISKIITGDLDALDIISGRFAIFVKSRKDSTRVFHDAIGSRSIHYSEHKDCVASHASLCAEACGIERDEDTKCFVEQPEYQLRGTIYLPGDLTVYGSIKALTPNCYLDTGTRRPARYWPRQKLQPSRKDEFFAACDEYFSRTAEFINSNYSALLGLTGGVDSRAVIAGLVAKGVTPEFITWTGKHLPDIEIPIVEKMITHFGLPHKYLDPEIAPLDDHTQAIGYSTDRATGFCREKSVLSANMRAICTRSDVYLWGYGGEILRGFYNRHGSALAEDLLGSFSRLYKTKRVKSPSDFFSSFTLKAMSGFIERTGYHREMSGFDVLDLFYWEQRMGIYGANMFNELDPAIYSMVGLNSRTLYYLAFGLPREYRLGTQLMLDLTARYDVEFSKIGVVS